jgi:hypothetical protein
MPTNANPKGGSVKRILKVKWHNQAWPARVIVRSRSHRVAMDLYRRTATHAEAVRIVWCAPGSGPPASPTRPRAGYLSIHVPVPHAHFPLSSSENSLKP